MSLCFVAAMLSMSASMAPPTREYPAKCWDVVPGGFKGSLVYTEAVAKLGRPGAVFLEIGALMGQSTCYMAHLLQRQETPRPIHFDVIDYWARIDSTNPAVAFSWLPSDQHAYAVKWGKGEMSMVWRHYMEVTESWESIRDVKHCSSTDPETAKKYAADSVDFIYLDTAHASGITATELELWWPKLKKSGSMLCGDDYIRVKDVCKKGTYENDIHTFFDHIGLEVVLWGHRQFCVGKGMSAACTAKGCGKQFQGD